jgi:hypothetical protein
VGNVGTLPGMGEGGVEWPGYSWLLNLHVVAGLGMCGAISLCPCVLGVQRESFTFFVLV